jgi:hypothetical protein
MRSIHTLLNAAGFVLLASTSNAQNLIVNGGFETATVPVPTGTPIPFYPSVLDGWSAVDTDGEFILGPDQAHNGNGFMSMLDNGGQNPGTPWLGVGGGPGFDRAGQVVDVQPNSDYLLTYWYRAGDGSRYGYGAGSTSVQVEEMTPMNISFANEQLPATATWQMDSIEFTTGPNTDQIIVLFSAFGPSTTDTWYDDVVVEPAHAPKGIEENTLPVNWTWNVAMAQLFVDDVEPGTTLTVFDALGAQVITPMNTGKGRAMIDLSALASGTYIAMASTTAAKSSYKLVLVR